MSENWTCLTCRNNNLLIIAIGVARSEYWPQFWSHLVRSNPRLKTLSIDRTPQNSMPCYAEALNYGLSIANFYNERWIMLCNNDVMITRKLDTSDLNPNTLYGFERHELATKKGLFSFICGWAYLAHRSVFRVIGDFDEQFKPLFFEDVDYCWRAQEKGIEIAYLDSIRWGVHHLETSAREKERSILRSDKRDQYMRNLDYLKGKHDL